MTQWSNLFSVEVFLSKVLMTFITESDHSQVALLAVITKVMFSIWALPALKVSGDDFFSKSF